MFGNGKLLIGYDLLVLYLVINADVLRAFRYREIFNGCQSAKFIV